MHGDQVLASSGKLARIPFFQSVWDFFYFIQPEFPFRAILFIDELSKGSTRKISMVTFLFLGITGENLVPSFAFNQRVPLLFRFP